MIDQEIFDLFSKMKTDSLIIFKSMDKDHGKKSKLIVGDSEYSFEKEGNADFPSLYKVKSEFLSVDELVSTFEFLHTFENHEIYALLVPASSEDDVKDISSLNYIIAQLYEYGIEDGSITFTFLADDAEVISFSKKSNMKKDDKNYEN